MQSDCTSLAFLHLFVIILCHALLECTVEYKLHIKALVLVLMHKHLLHSDIFGLKYKRSAYCIKASCASLLPSSMLFGSAIRRSTISSSQIISNSPRFLRNYRHILNISSTSAGVSVVNPTSLPFAPQAFFAMRAKFLSSMPRSLSRL